MIGDFNGRLGNDSEGCARSHGRRGVVTSTTMVTDSCASQIDHHLIASGRTGSNFEGTMRSDHQLLMATCAIKLRKTKIKEYRVRRIDVAKLKVAQTKAGFQLEFRNRFQDLRKNRKNPTSAVSTRQ